MEETEKHNKEQDFNSTVPPLSRDLSADIFKKHYYDKKTLTTFCRQHSIPTHGLKNELNERVEFFLKTKEIPHVKPLKKIAAPPDSHLGLTLDRQVINYKSDPATRSFFIKHLPEFTGFSAYVQKWLKERLSNHEIFTYADILEEHRRFLKEKSSQLLTGSPKNVAHDSCQLNQFFIDYAHDKAKKIHSPMEAWKLVRNSAGDKSYARYKKEYEKS